MRTRSTAAPQSAAEIQSEMVSSAHDPPRLLILPEDRSSEARICTLAHPRTSRSSRYYFDPNKGIYEFTRIAAPKSAPRSWLIGRRAQLSQENAGAENGAGESSIPTAQAEDVADESEESPSTGKDVTHSRPVSAGYVLKNAELLIATPIDYLFLILPSFANATSAKGLFLSVDDLLEKLSENSKHFHLLVNHKSTQRAMEERMRAVCDSVNAGDEKMYRLNERRLLEELVQKAKNMVAMGLPPSMEEKFVRRALESPIEVIKRTISDSNSPQVDTNPSEPGSIGMTKSEASTASLSSENSAASDSTEETVPDDSNPTGDDSALRHLQRVHTALIYMIHAYVPQTLAASLELLITSPESPTNFMPLAERLIELTKLRAECLTARSLGDFSRKRSMYEDDEALESRADKKRRKEEEEKKKKAGESRSIRDLKKVDTKGMKKMSDFFGKGAATKKK